jgi:glycosyltransferase involved in cell wall biosynthesis
MISVLHVITGLGSGGAEAALTRLVCASHPGRFRHTVVSLTDDGIYGANLRAGGIEVHTLGLRRGAIDPLSIWRLAMLARRVRPHIVQSWLYHADLLATLATRRKGRALIWGLRCSDMDLRQYRPLTRLVLAVLARLSPLPDVVVANSQCGRDYHADVLGYRPKQWRVIANGFDMDHFRPAPAAGAAVRAELGLPQGVPVVGVVARLDPMKDHATFLDAFARLQAVLPGVRAVLVGRGVEQLDAPPAVLRLGERRDVARLLTAFDVCCLPSAFGEGFPNVLGEAMASGVPCVATRVGDAERIIGECGRVVAPRDAVALAGALAELLCSPERAVLGEQARQRIQRHFSMPSIVAAYEALWEALIADGGGVRQQTGGVL